MALDKPTGARVLVGELRKHGVDRIFCVPGESYLAVLDALIDHPDISVITCRHEGAATMMAEAYGKLTGKPGIAFVTRGPGATNGSSGVHVAHQDSTPLIMFVGQVARSTTERGAFQEIDYKAMFGSLAKWATQINDSNRIAEVVGRAFHVAAAGRPGPVVVALPEDMLTEVTTATASSRHYSAARPELTREAAVRIGQMLQQAARPVLIVGGGGWDSATATLAAQFAEAWTVPIVASFRCNDYVDNNHPNYVGNLGLGANPTLINAIQDSDLVLAVGARLGEISSNNYTLLDIPAPKQTFIHIHADSSEIGRVYQPTLAFNADAFSSFRQLTQLRSLGGGDSARVARLRAAYEAWTTPSSIPGSVQVGEIMQYLLEHLPVDAIITNGAGNFAIWPNRYHRYQTYRSMLAPTSGSMGYGLPAAIVAKLLHRERTVVCFSGDGDFLMTGQELATAIKDDANIVIILINNNMYGTIRMHQERVFPKRRSATDLVNPDFVALAKAYGAYGERIARTEDFAAAFQRALACQKPAVLEIVLDQEAITPTETIASIRSNAAKVD